MAGITLHYFDILARGEAARMILTYYGMEFADHRMKGDEWRIFKAEGFCEFGQLPMLEIDGKELVQSFAIYRYLCQKNGAYPTDPHQAYLCESICDLRNDIYSGVMPFFYKGDQPGIEAWYRTSMPRMLGMIEQRLLKNGTEGRFFVGDQVSMADFVLFQFGYDHFLRPDLRGRFEGVVRDNAPTFYQFLLRFPEGSATLRDYLASRPERAF